MQHLQLICRNVWTRNPPGPPPLTPSPCGNILQLRLCGKDFLRPFAWWKRVRRVCKRVLFSPRSSMLSSCVIWLYCCNPHNPIVESAPWAHTHIYLLCVFVVVTWSTVKILPLIPPGPHRRAPNIAGSLSYQGAPAVPERERRTVCAPPAKAGNAFSIFFLPSPASNLGVFTTAGEKKESCRTASGGPSWAGVQRRGGAGGENVAGWEDLMWAVDQITSVLEHSLETTGEGEIHQVQLQSVNLCSTYKFDCICKHLI